MGGLGFPEMVVILIIVLVILGRTGSLHLVKVLAKRSKDLKRV